MSTPVTTLPRDTPHGLKPEPSRLLIDVAEAAHLLSLSRSQVYIEMTAGRLASVKVGRRRLVPRAALEQFIASLNHAA